MIITLTGAYKNAGDYLIGYRASELLKKYVDGEIVNIDRKKILSEHYEVFNRAKAVILCGGPAYQKNIYPNIYPIDLDKVKSAVVPFGLGCKGQLGQNVSDYTFSEYSSAFIKQIHRGISASSVRDVLTLEVVQNLGVENVTMTGCPAWYDLENIQKDYSHIGDVKVLNFSAPAVFDGNFFRVLSFLTKRFKKSERRLLLHHGFLPNNNLRGWIKGASCVSSSLISLLRGWKTENLKGSHQKLQDIYSEGDLHVGYRVHGHLYCLSQRRASYLISEDSRGVGQSLTLGQPLLESNQSNLVENLQKILDKHFDSSGESIKKSVEIMKSTFPVMTEFLKSIH